MNTRDNKPIFVGAIFKIDNQDRKGIVTFIDSETQDITLHLLTDSGECPSSNPHVIVNADKLSAAVAPQTGGLKGRRKGEEETSTIS